MKELIKITKSKGEFKINGISIFTSDYYTENVKESTWKDGRPSLLRDKNVTKHYVDSNFNIENIKSLFKELNINIDFQKMNETFNNSDAEYFSKGKSKDWTAKSLGSFFNDVLDKKTFISYD